MKIVILDGHALNPGDLSWDCFQQFGTVTYYDRTETESDTIARIGFDKINAEILSDEILSRKAEILNG